MKIDKIKVVRECYVFELSESEVKDLSEILTFCIGNSWNIKRIDNSQLLLDEIIKAQHKGGK